MKKGVVIGASSDAIHAIKTARKFGVYVVALDGNKNAAGFAFADEIYNVDISNLEEVKKCIETIRPDFVIPIPIGRYLSTTGYINQEFDLKGVKYEPTVYSTDKWLFHQKMNAKGLRNIQACLVNDKSNFDELESVPYPSIMKPRFGSGSRDVFFITSKEELTNAYQKVIEQKEDFVLEQAFSGEEYSVDGAVIDGKVQITLLRKKTITPLPIRQPIASFSVSKTDKIYDYVYDHIVKVVECLKYDNCLLNVDLIIKDNQVSVIEIAPRPSGHFLNDLFVPMASGVDLIGEYIKYLLDEKYSFESKNIKQIEIRFFDFEEKCFNHIPTVQEVTRSSGSVLKAWQCNIKQGEWLDKVVNGHSIMGRGYFIIEGESEEQMKKESAKILSLFN